MILDTNSFDHQLYQESDKVETIQDFPFFVNLLRQSLTKEREGWENLTLEDYLFALERYAESFENVLHNSRELKQDYNLCSPSWKLYATLLYVAKDCE